MALSYEQKQELVALLEPEFQVENRRILILNTAFKNAPEFTKNIKVKGLSAEQFTVALLNNLIDQKWQTGEPAAVQLLRTIQNQRADGMSIKLQPYIDMLNQSGPVTASSSASSSSASTTHTPIFSSNSRRKRRRRTSPIKRAFRSLGQVVKWKYVLAVILVVITIPTAGIIVLASDSYARVQDALANLKRVTNSLSQQSFANLTTNDFDRLQASVDNLSHALTYARQQSTLLQNFSFVNHDLAATFKLLSAGERMTMAAETMLEGLQPTVVFLLGNQTSGSAPDISPVSSGERMIELLQTGQGEFLTAESQLQDSENILQQIDLQSVSSQTLLQIEQVNQYYDQVKNINQVLLKLPDWMSAVFGVSDAKNYLVLSQNNDELRPSGGYISTFGWLRIRRFQVTDYGYSPTTTTSPNPPPEELASTLNIPDWWLHFAHPIYSAWDESWYADFPSTANMSAWYYDKGQNPRAPVDGVIAIDITGFQELLGAIGDVNVPDYNETVNATNFRDVIYRIRADGGDSHKEFLAATYQQIFSEWQSLDEQHSTALMNAVMTALREKHIMVYFTDPDLNTVSNLLGWSGAQTPGNYDYLMVADTNEGNKSNSSVVREVTYDVAIQPDGSLKSRASISYDYPATLAAKDPGVKPAQYGNQKDYYNLMQVFVPKGITLTGSNNLQNDLKQAPTDKMTILVTDTKVDFDSSERFQFLYTTPPLIESIGSYKRYRLLLQKQPGTQNDTTSVQVTLPPGATIVQTSPDPVANYTLDNPIVEFRVQLNTDQWIEVIYQ